MGYLYRKKCRWYRKDYFEVCSVKDTIVHDVCRVTLSYLRMIPSIIYISDIYKESIYASQVDSESHELTIHLPNGRVNRLLRLVEKQTLKHFTQSKNIRLQVGFFWRGQSNFEAQ